MAIMKRNDTSVPAGQLRSNVQFQQNAPTQDGSGGWIDNYTTSYTCRGRLLQLSGRRSDEDQEIVRNQQYELVVRYTTAITVDINTRVIVDGGTYLIVNFEKVNQQPHWYRFIISKNA